MHALVVPLCDQREVLKIGAALAHHLGHPDEENEQIKRETKQTIFEGIYTVYIYIHIIHHLTYSSLPR